MTFPIRVSVERAITPAVDHPALQRAPIREAIVDVRVEATSNDETVERYVQHLGGEFQPAEPRDECELTWDTKNGTASSRVKQRGWLARSFDGTRVVQARTDRLTFSRLPPYQSWAATRALAEHAWDRYRQATKPQRIHRLALRYINRIDLPAPVGDFDDYFRTFPRIGEGIQQSLAGFFMRIVVPHKGVHVAITQTIDSSTASEAITPVILDIEAFEVCDLDALTGEFWHRFEHLRVVKNDIFFGSLTKQAWGLFT